MYFLQRVKLLSRLSDLALLRLEGGTNIDHPQSVRNLRQMLSNDTVREMWKLFERATPKSESKVDLCSRIVRARNFYTLFGYR
jgi:hypothetical protein